MQNVQVKGIRSNAAPFIAVEDNGYFQVGDTVRIEDINSLSHMTVGTLSGLIHRGEERSPMALVQWLDNAPPIRILMTKLVRMKPVKFWMVVSEIDGDYVREGGVESQREGTLSPARKFFDQDEARDTASSLCNRYRRNYILLESSQYVSTENGTFAAI